MVTVPYAYEIPYTPDPLSGDSFPVLPLRVINPRNPDQEPLDINTYLDSGAQRSLFDGWIATALGLDLLSGRPFPMVPSEVFSRGGFIRCGSSMVISANSSWRSGLVRVRSEETFWDVTFSTCSKSASVKDTSSSM